MVGPNVKSLALLLAVSLSIFSAPTFAQIETLSQAINESGRLRMLSQRIAKAQILKTLDIQPGNAQQQYTASQKKFDQNLKDLKLFSTTLTSNTAIEVALSAIDTEWNGYKEVLSQGNNVNDILVLSDRTLLACEELVSQLENTAQRQSARWVNLSGRQRMLSQRIAKFYSAISLSGDTAAFSPELLKAIDEFDSALIQLINSPDNTKFVQHKLNKVQTQWNFSKQGFKLLDSGASTPLVISMTTETILKQMNDITALYEEIDNNKKLLAAN